jgi:hypothetical protein
MHNCRQDYREVSLGTGDPCGSSSYMSHYPFTALAPPSFPSHPGTPILMDCRSEGSLTVNDYARCWTSKDTRSRCQRKSLRNIPQLLTSADRSM